MEGDAVTNEDIIRMAHEAGLHIATDHDWMPIIALAYAKKLVEIARAEERERILDMCKEGLWDGEGIRYHLEKRGEK